MQKIFAVLILVLGFSGAWAVDSIYSSNKGKILKIPHYYEYDGNPKNYWWCAHGALRMAIEPAGIYKSLYDIHNDFKLANKGLGGYNSSKTNDCQTGYCGFPKLMEKTINKIYSNNWYIKTRRTNVNNYNSFVNLVVSSINNNKSIIILSKNYYNYSTKTWKQVGHYFNIIGYYKTYSNIYLFFRDTFKKNGGKYWDFYTTAPYIWSKINRGKYKGNPVLIIED